MNLFKKKEPAPKTDDPRECIEPDPMHPIPAVMIDVSDLTPAELLMHKAAFGTLGQPVLKIKQSHNF